ncbi:hypothetical protein [Denitratimonas sp. CY0512]|uniref:hypothetical protein n=1 Tax=Denitratimonas sp. CY0512 TaxID=3131940 RepID=UPI0030AAED11
MDINTKPVFKSRISILCLFLALACSPLVPDAHAQQTAEVVVRGSGETLEAARLDAIRQATQQVTQQLIVADRKIEDDAIVMDRVLSTMNGYVEKFESLDSGTDANGTWLEARIIISESRIENFIAEVRGSGADVDGQSVFAELQRTRAQKESAEDIMRRAFEGYPHAALNAKVVSVRVPDGELEFLSDHLLMDVVIETDPAWISSALGLIESISNDSISLKPNAAEREAGRFISGDRCFTGRYLIRGNNQPSMQLVSTQCRDSRFWNSLKDGGMPFCFVQKDGAKCHTLPKSVLDVIGRTDGASLNLVVDFVGDDWQTTKLSSSCLVAHGLIGSDVGKFPQTSEIKHWNFKQVPSLIKREAHGIYGKFSYDVQASVVDVGQINATYAVRLDEFDLNATRSTIVVPVLKRANSDMIIPDMSSDSKPDCSELMREAIDSYRAKS